MTDFSLPLNPGPPLAGKYRIDRVIGRGGMGVVVLAWHLELLEWRAIKFLSSDSGDKPEHVARFLREARAVVKIKNEHAVKVQDTGRLDSGEPFIVMEYLAGEDLKDLLRRRGRLPVSEAVGYVQQLLEALEEAHRRGIIHRDLKPGNLFVTRNAAGEPFLKVLDFGISKLQAATELTNTTDTVGTPHYMSPTHMLSSRNVDARDDLWSVGVILYELLVGRLPFPGETLPEVCLRVAQETPELPSVLQPNVPQALDAVIMRCLEKAREERFETAADLSEALASFSAYRPPQLSVPEGTFSPAVTDPSGHEALLDTLPNSDQVATLSVSTTDAAVIQTGAHAAEDTSRSPLLVTLLAAAILFTGTSAGLGLLWLSGRGSASAQDRAAASAAEPAPQQPAATATADVAAVETVVAESEPKLAASASASASATASASASSVPAASASSPQLGPAPLPWPPKPQNPEPDEPEDPFAK